MANKDKGGDGGEVDQGGRPPEGIDDKDKMILAMLNEDPGTSLNEMARATGLSKSGVKRRLRRPQMVRFLRKLHEKTEEIIIRGQRSAAQTLLRLCRSQNDRVALEAARILLNPLLNKTTTEHKLTKELVFQAQIGREGQLMQDVINVGFGEDATKKIPPSQLPEDPRAMGMPAVAEALEGEDDEEVED